MPILQGFAVFAAGSAQGNIASSLAISFAPRVVQEATQRPKIAIFTPA
jgi:F0F1-type ATP synthase membrane subunit c/vacuolar-type H+-ATPase subunit K